MFVVCFVLFVVLFGDFIVIYLFIYLFIWGRWWWWVSVCLLCQLLGVRCSSVVDVRSSCDGSLG